MLTLNLALCRAFEEFSARPAFLSEDGQIVSFERLGQTVEAFIARLHAEGITAQHRVLPLVDNRVIRFCLRFSLARIGATVDQTRIKPPSAPIEDDIDAVIAFDEQQISGSRKIVFGQDWMQSPTISQIPISQDFDYIFASSGSTGMPKQMRVRGELVHSKIIYYDELAGASTGAVYISIPDHTSICNRFMLRAILSGQAVMGPQGSLEKTLEGMHALEVRELVLTPVSLQAFLEAAEQGLVFPKLNRIFVPGAAASLDVLKGAQKLLAPEICINAGANETACYSLGMFDADCYEQGWSGKINPWVEAELRGKGKFLQFGNDAGRLFLRVSEDLRVTEYLNGDPACDDEGWFATGDIATISPEGDLYLTGRVDNLINLSGSKFAPELIEMIATQCIGVLRAAAVLLKGDGRTADKLGLVAVVSNGFNEEQLKLMLNTKLNVNTQIDVAICDALPMLPSGKLNRAALADLFPT